ncbi:hypothetical protein HS048_01855 [Planomonospora sp. ID91781]|uniref:hypothetical protein n=1 Tax=Planomonospora sp. ID91781 TaxID=2738135 RepID=UPI0018C44526|nr:hypothetical protein [Planomonospora sp. ID91781]MBG0819507.1 hypothetical protein [Planomonospora sp. ID91781]
MRKRSFVLAVLAGVTVLAAPVTASAAAGTSGTSGTPGAATAAVTSGAAGTRTVSFRGMRLRVPSGWQVHRQGDWMLVQTGRCDRPAYFAPGCKGFWVLGPEAIKYGREGFGAYTGEQPFYPASDVQSCPFSAKTGQVIGKPTAVGLRRVGRGHKAKYVSWFGRCVTHRGGRQTATFAQREWFLPTSKILVVDVWNTPGLSNVLKNATWS